MDRLFKRFLFIAFPLWFGFLISGLAGLSEADSRSNATVDLTIQKIVREGESLTMHCKFHHIHQDTSIYTVKWYKGRHEIFRFTPKERPEKKSFPFLSKDTQLVIDEENSKIDKLVVRQVPMALRGEVGCEVTWEPTFTSIKKVDQLVVVSSPKQKPKLEVELVSSDPSSRNMVRGEKNVTFVKLDDTLKASCSSGPAMPAPNLTFYINDEKLEFYRGVSNVSSQVQDSENNTETRTARISLKLNFSHFKLNRIRVKCYASLFNVYNDTSEFSTRLLPPSRERHTTASGYGLLGRNGDTRSQPGKLVWSITTIGVCGKLVLLLLPKAPL